MSSGLLVRSLILGTFVAAAASAQTIPFNLLVTVNGVSSSVSNDSTISVNAPIGTQTQVVVKATYTGTSQATVSSQPTVLGSTDFKAAVTDTLPEVLSPGQVLTFTVTYTPSTANGSSAQVSVTYTEPGSGGTTTSNSIVLVFQGTSPSFTLSYILQTDNNTVQIQPGGTIPFNPTQLNSTAQANLNITNTGSGSGTISSIALTSGGPLFKLQGIPLLPFTLASGKTLQLTISYTPTAVENDTGQVTITYGDGSTATVNLTGSGATSS